jgi:tetratricopeptide (TPR) repeat protein
MHFSIFACIIILVISGSSSCSTMKDVLALNNAEAEQNKPIANPFGPYNGGTGPDKENIILRTKKGDRSVEVEFPNDGDNKVSDFVIPVSPAFNDKRGLASEPGPLDDSVKKRPPSYSDREISAKFPKNLPEDEGRRTELERDMGLVASDNETPERSTSYLAGVAFIKQLYGNKEYERALLECDQLIKMYQTDPKLHAMRGTLLERIGKLDLALKSWKQALRYDPDNTRLKRFIERKEMKQRGIASP